LKLGEAIFDYYQEDADVSCTINDLAEEIVCGKTPSTSYKEHYGEDIPFITIPDLHNSPVIVRTERYLSNIGAETQKKKTLPAHSICVSCIATPGLVSLTSELSQTNQQINSIICKKSIPPLYVYYLMRSSSDVIINLGSSGSATLNLNKTQFSQIKINILAPIEMLNFNNETKYILQLIELNSKTNVILESLRDMLLPLLMSGEIDVSKLDLGS
jgi:type I restriction enzyme S subunit